MREYTIELFLSTLIIEPLSVLQSSFKYNIVNHKLLTEEH